jgi:hypothetical protein
MVVWVIKEHSQCLWTEVQIPLVQSVIWRFPNSLPWVEESMVGCMGVYWVYYKLGKGIMKGNMVGPRWNLEVKRACFSFSGAFKTYANPQGGQNQVLPIQWSMSGDQVRVIPEPECCQSETWYFSMSPELSLILAPPSASGNSSAHKTLQRWQLWDFHIGWLQRAIQSGITCTVTIDPQGHSHKSVVKKYLVSSRIWSH